MKSKIILMLFIAVMFFTASVEAQKKARQGKICGDPMVKCKGSENFQPYDLVFDTGKQWTIYESEYFYGVVLKSAKMPEWGNCENPQFPESERLPIQEMFPRNKVFALNCVDTGTNYYTGVSEKSAFIAVYAGRTLTEANKFFKTVKDTGKFSGIRVRRMQIGINGT